MEGMYPIQYFHRGDVCHTPKCLFLLTLLHFGFVDLVVFYRRCAEKKTEKYCELMTDLNYMLKVFFVIYLLFDIVGTGHFTRTHRSNTLSPHPTLTVPSLHSYVLVPKYFSR